MIVANEVNYSECYDSEPYNMEKVADVLFDPMVSFFEYSSGSEPKWCKVTIRLYGSDDSPVKVWVDDNRVGGFCVGTMSAKTFADLTMYSFLESHVDTAGL